MRRARGTVDQLEQTLTAAPALAHPEAKTAPPPSPDVSVPAAQAPATMAAETKVKLRNHCR